MYLHEAIPGHHYQLSLQPESREFWYPATVEGWGAYCEDLGTELGVYANPAFSLRQVGVGSREVRPRGPRRRHPPQGWSRKQALDHWRANVPDQDDIAVREVDRITRWPPRS
jgi:uncharacterized protein (DUF885 family)